MGGVEKFTDKHVGNTGAEVMAITGQLGYATYCYTNIAVNPVLMKATQIVPV